MNIVASLKAFIYCAGGGNKSDAIVPKVDGDWHKRWLSLRTLLEASQIPTYLVATNESQLNKCRDAATFDFAAAALSREQLIELLSSPSTEDPTSVLIGGCYAVTLVTDVALGTLKEGYDTFVVWDRVWAISEIGLEAAKARLLQAGAVPTSVDQVTHRWG